VHFLHTAQASLSELDTQLDLSRALGYITMDSLAPIENLMEIVDKLLTGLIKSLKGANFP
jgi:four helix bundle protein